MTDTSAQPVQTQTSPFTTPSTQQPAQPASTTTPPTNPPPPTQSQPPTPPQQPEEQKKGGWHFSKATLVLIVILGGIASFFVYLALNPKTKTQKPPEVATQPTPTPYAQSVLAFEPAIQESTQEASLTPQPKKNSKALTYNVMLTTNANTVNAVQLELGFDPTTIMVDDITAGPFMPNPVQLTKDVNNKTGRVSYAIGVGPNDKGLKGAGVVATITLEFLPSATASSTTLSFLPKTLIAGAGVNPSVLKSSTDITIPLPQPTSGVTPTTVVVPTVSQ